MLVSTILIPTAARFYAIIQQTWKLGNSSEKREIHGYVIIVIKYSNFKKYCVLFKAIEGKNLLLAEEIAAIRANLEHFRVEDKSRFRWDSETPEVGSVPEELFRRYYFIIQSEFKNWATV